MPRPNQTYIRYRNDYEADLLLDQHANRFVGGVDINENFLQQQKVSFTAAVESG